MECSVTTQYKRKGIETAFLENDHLRIEVLTGKGGDITEIRDKRTDTNVLFESPHEWYSPKTGPIGAPDGEFTYLDHYPGGWQNVLPAAGGPSASHGAPLALHGEAPIVPWDTTVVEDTAERVDLQLNVSLSRYPLSIERHLVLEAKSPTLTVTDDVTNQGEVPVAYSWLQHIALGEPLIGPEARLDVPCETILSDPDQGPNAQFPPDASYTWPVAQLPEETADLRKFPPKDERIHDVLAFTDLSEGWYTITNPSLDLGVTVEFPSDLYEYVWYWRAFGGFEEAPFFGRNYNAGLEPCTSVPNAGIEDAKDNGSANTLMPGEEVSSTLRVETHAV